MSNSLSYRSSSKVSDKTNSFCMFLMYVLDELMSLSLARDHVKEFVSFTRSSTLDMKDVIDPVVKWIESLIANLPSITTMEIDADLAHATPVTNDFIRTLLGIWEVLSAMHKSNDSLANDAKDNYVQSYSVALDDITRELKLDLISKHLSRLQLSFGNQSQHRGAIELILPFLENYLLFVQWHRIAYSRWNKSLWKLLRVLSATLSHISADGFCQPEESDGSDFGDGPGESGGLGFGKGAGANNITDEIEDEAQVEDLKGGREDDERTEQENFHDALELDDGLNTNDYGDLTEEKDKVDEMDIDDENGKDSNDDSQPPGINENFWNQENLENGSDKLADEIEPQEDLHKNMKAGDVSNEVRDNSVDNTTTTTAEKGIPDLIEANTNDSEICEKTPDTTDQNLNDEVQPLEELLPELNANPEHEEHDVSDCQSSVSTPDTTPDEISDNANADAHTLQSDEKEESGSEVAESDFHQAPQSSKAPTGGRSEGYKNGHRERTSMKPELSSSLKDSSQSLLVICLVLMH